MRARSWLSLARLLSVLSLLLASCAPAAAPTPTAAQKPAPTAAPATKEATPAAKPAATPAAPAATPKPAAGQPRSGGILNVGHFADPISYDPIQEASVQSVSLVIPNYSGIVQHDPLQADKVIGDLAEKWDVSPDGLTYTFHLYKNVKFHDGTPLTSEDARFSMELTRKPPRGVTSPRQEWLKAVDNIETPDKDTLKMTLKYVSASFLHNLGDGRVVVVPKQVFEAKGNMKRDIVGTGPFKFKGFTPGTSFSIVKNPDYFIKGRPYLDGITWYVVPDVATRFAALRTHRIQLTPFASQGLTPSQSELIRKELSDKISVQKYPSLIFIAFWMPHVKAPWNDVRVRRAVELTIDRPKVIKVGAEGSAEVSGYMPKGSWSLPDSEFLNLPGWRPNKDADIAEAKKLMAEAGHAQGFKTTTITRNVTNQERTALAVKEQLAAIGIDVTVNVRDQGTMFELLYARNYDTAVFSGSASFDDPDQVFGQNFASGVPRNFSEATDPQLDKWYDEQSRTLDAAKRKEIVFNMQRRMFEIIPASMLFWTVYELGSWREVRDLKPGIGVYNNLKFQNVWIGE
ncbi:MAG: ABC transporter substrate-binding protein [Chloroflexi bacterium]|nr:ABC transporter substrate-binding protein [Chloroflexota bacterium]